MPFINAVNTDLILLRHSDRHGLFLTNQQLTCKQVIEDGLNYSFDYQDICTKYQDYVIYYLDRTGNILSFHFEQKSKKNFSKIAVVVDEENDLHYYREDSNGKWSHKPGGREVTDKDAAGAIIHAPHRASRYYPKEDANNTGLNYSSFCSYMCVPRDEPLRIAGGSRRTRRSRK